MDFIKLCTYNPVTLCRDLRIQDAFAIAAYVVAFGTVSVGSVQALLVM